MTDAADPRFEPRYQEIATFMRAPYVPSMEGVDEVVIDKDVVGGKKDPIRVFSEQQEAVGTAA